MALRTLCLILAFIAAATGSASAQAPQEELQAAVLQRQTEAASVNREADPVGWANAQVSLGDALIVASADSLDPAITAYRNALEVLTRENDADRWAEVQSTFGTALVHRVRQNILGWAIFSRMMNSVGQPVGATPPFEGEADLRDAIRAFNAALEVHTRQRDPERWATLKVILGYTYTQAAILAMMNGDNEAQRAATSLSEQSYNAAMQVLTRRSSPERWALVQEGLSVLYELNQQRGRAIAAARRAADGYTDAGQPTRAQEMQAQAEELEQRRRRRE